MKSYKWNAGAFAGLHTFDLPLPTRCSRKSLVLFKRDQPFFVELGKLDLPTKGDGPSDFYLYVARYELAGALVGDEVRPKDDIGHFLVFYICEVTESKVNVWTLSQLESPVFSDEPEKNDYLLADKIGKLGPTLIDRQPRWKKNQAIWPTVAGTPMIFVGETDLLDTAINRKYATYGERVFWFFAVHEGSFRFKAEMQRVKFQSADDHYALEARKQR